MARVLLVHGVVFGMEAKWRNGANRTEWGEQGPGLKDTKGHAQKVIEGEKRKEGKLELCLDPGPKNQEKQAWLVVGARPESKSKLRLVVQGETRRHQPPWGGPQRRETPLLDGQDFRMKHTTEKIDCTSV
ncbi:hypothetical protein BGZ63DRAFT_399571 [Mariannaea sp. PMI_226]|nr:hypothetical protein BGZ63DRAFT_399571 [Mariannaea sp. PMI_226]